MGASDVRGAGPTFALTSFTSNEPEKPVDAGNHSDDVQNGVLNRVDPGFGPRVERAGTGDGRTYTITYTATDMWGNIPAYTVSTVVPRDRSKRTEGAVPEGPPTPPTQVTGHRPGVDSMGSRKITQDTACNPASAQRGSYSISSAIMQ